MRLIYLAFVLLSLPLSAQIIGDLETGLASYFSDSYAGAETAYGVTYRPTDLVGAHKTYPHNAVVRVRNLENGREVEVRIIDEGPFIRGRIIEVSRAAAERLGMVGKQTTQVEVRLVSLPGGSRPSTPEPSTAVANERPSDNRTSTPPPTAAPQTAERPVSVPSTSTPPTNRATSPNNNSQANSSPPATSRPAPPPAATPAPTNTRSASATNNSDLVTEGGFGPGLYDIEIKQGPTSGFGVQVASLTGLENAMTRVTELQGQWFEDILLRREGTGNATAYKVILGQFAERDAAAQYARDLKRRYRIDGFVVSLGQ